MKKLIICISVTVIVAFVSTVVCAVATVEVAMPAFVDSAVHSINQLSAGYGPPTTHNLAYVGNLNGTTYRSLIYYDVVSSLAALDAAYPSGWGLQYAELRFAPDYVWDEGTNITSFYPILKPYVFDEVTWTNQNATTAWAAPGLQAGTDYSATADISFDWDTYGLRLIDVTSIVQGWMDDPSSYHGWLFKSANETGPRTFRGAAWSGKTVHSGGVITLTIIPEPGMFMIVGLGLTLLKFKRK